MTDKNRFGGIAKSSYTPMSELEQEAISRLVDARELKVVVKGWGVVEKPRVVYGDLRLGIAFRMNFVKPEFPTPVHFFDLELRTRSGILLFAERQTAMYGGNPISVCQGMFLDMVWDIAVMAIDPKIVKAILPGAHGLTSRFQDKDTGDLTLFGNTKMNSGDKSALVKLRAGERSARDDTKVQVKKAEAAMDKAGIKLDPSKMT
jgi:hypothetical protein